MIAEESTKAQVKTCGYGERDFVAASLQGAPGRIRLGNEPSAWVDCQLDANGNADKVPRERTLPMVSRLLLAPHVL